MTLRLYRCLHIFRKFLYAGRDQVRKPGSAGGGSAPWRISTRTSRQSGESSRRLTSSLRRMMEMGKRGEFYWPCLKHSFLGNFNLMANLYVCRRKCGNIFCFHYNQSLGNNEAQQPIQFLKNQYVNMQWATVAFLLSNILRNWLPKIFNFSCIEIWEKETYSGCLYDPLILINS